MIKKGSVSFAATFLLLLSIGALFLYPFLWMFFAGFKSDPEIFRAYPLLPESYRWDHYRSLLSGEWIPYPRQFLNTLFVATFQSLGATAITAMAGFLLAQYRFRGRIGLFLLALGVVFVPRQALALPLFNWMNTLHLLDHPTAVLLPGLVSGIGLLYFAQAFAKLPSGLLDLARCEGASESRLFFLALPWIRPSLIAYGLIHFMLAWQEHLLAVVLLFSPEHLLVSPALASLLGGGSRLPYGVMMAGATLTVLPVALLFFALRKPFRTALSRLTET
jgi:ABC-type glycerol-3-phosphate transport system permease component